MLKIIQTGKIAIKQSNNHPAPARPCYFVCCYIAKGHKLGQRVQQLLSHAFFFGDVANYHFLILKDALAVFLKYPEALVPRVTCVLYYRFKATKLRAYRHATTTVLTLQNSLSP